ncbi:MAG: metallophosphoesterase, partial [Candidatus Thorarchaeota archaeon]
ALLKKRGDMGGVFNIGDLKKAKLDEHENITLIGMITEKITLKNGGLMFNIEDPTGSIMVTISSKLQELLGKAGALLEDQVIGFFGKIYDNRLTLEDFTFPDIPLTRKSNLIKDNISVCMTSDLHIGSKEFLEDSFNDLINFLNGKVDDPYQQTLASQIKYLIIGGDLVEGIGIYPKQEDDLIISDIYKQYDHAADLLSKVPNWIQILIISGNHDACRLALPQPAISKDYAPKLWAMPNVTMLSNPSTVNIHGKIFLLYHGNSFEDVASLTPGLSMNDANGPMLYTLRYRHLAPTFGRRTSIVPSSTDELVIEHVPDVFHTGHIHINSHTKYRGVECINSGTFQSQTDYMLSKNIIPTPGRVPIYNLMTSKLHELVFYKNEEDKA